MPAQVAFQEGCASGWKGLLGGAGAPCVARIRKSAYVSRSAASMLSLRRAAADSACSALPGSVRVLTEPIWVQGAGEKLAVPTSDLESPEQSEAMSWMAFKSVPPFLKNSADVMMFSSGWILRSPTSARMSAVGFFRSDTATARTTSQYRDSLHGRVVAAPQAVSAHGLERPRCVSAISAVRIRALTFGASGLFALMLYLARCVPSRRPDTWGVIEVEVGEARPAKAGSHRFVDRPLDLRDLPWSKADNPDQVSAHHRAHSCALAAKPRSRLSDQATRPRETRIGFGKSPLRSLIGVSSGI